MTHKEMIEVIAAHEHGARIEYRWKSSNLTNCRTNWFGHTSMPTWNFAECEYRVAPPAKVKMWQWIYRYPHGSIYLSVEFYRDEKHAKGLHQNQEMIGPAKWTEIEVDAKD